MNMDLVKTMDKRLDLRPLGEEDFSMLCDLYHNELTAKYMRHGTHKSIEETRKLLDYYLEEDQFAYAIIEQATNECIGYLSLSLVDKDKQSFTYTIMSYEAYWGGGYSSEATQLFLQKAKELPVQEILSYIYQENIGSCKVMEKCGFEKWLILDEESEHPVLVYRYQMNRE